MSDMRTPLRRVRGLGSAKDGTTHFWAVRLTSLALVPLTFFAVGLVFSLIGKDAQAARATIASPLVAVPLLLFIVLSVEHMRLGMQEVIADYVHGDLAKVVALALNTAFCLLVGAASVFAVLKIAFGA